MYEYVVVDKSYDLVAHCDVVAHRVGSNPASPTVENSEDTVYTVKSRGREGNLPLRPKKEEKKKKIFCSDKIFCTDERREQCQG